MTIKRNSLLRSGAAMAIALSATGLAADELRFWTTEEQPERLARQEAMAADFAAASGHTVEVIPVTENDLGTRATAAFAAGGIETDRPVITTCGSGVTACGLALGLALLGNENVFVYDGSWSEWGASDALVETSTPSPA